MNSITLFRSLTGAAIWNETFNSSVSNVIGKKERTLLNLTQLRQGRGQIAAAHQEQVNAAGGGAASVMADPTGNRPALNYHWQIILRP